MGTWTWTLFLRIFFLLPLLTEKKGSCAEIGKFFTKTPQSIVAPPGDRVTFQCETNIPSEQVRWKLNGRFLSSNDSDIRITGSFLVVKVGKVRERYIQQVGDYQCVAEFGAEALTSLPAQLTIAQLDPFPPSRGNSSLTLVEGNAVAVSCDPPYSNPAPVVQFWKDGRPLEQETPNSYVSDTTGVLHIFNVTTQDSGIYWCVVSNHITTETYPAPYFTKLTVVPKGKGPRTPPEFVVKPKNYFLVPKDGNVSLDCVAIGNPPPFVTWRKLRSTLTPNSKVEKGSLHLFNVDMSQEGEYVCEVYNGVGEALTSLSTVVVNSMPNITKPPASQVVEEGGELMLDCVTDGLPKPFQKWVFNGHTLQNDGNVQIMDWGLRISRVEKRHAGLFQCFAGNPTGTVFSPAEVRVLPKQFTKMASDQVIVHTQVRPAGVLPPTAILKEDLSPSTDDDEFPHHHKKYHRGKHHKRRKHKGQEMTPPSKPVMNRVSDDSVMVRWNVPPNSGYPIQFFKIQYKEMNKRNSRWMTLDDDIPPHIHSYEVKDLKLGHAYKFRIAAVYSNNDNKVGPNSEKFVLQRETTMRRPVSVPVITNALPFNDTAILLRWKHMKPVEGIDGYFIYYRETTSASEYQKVTVLGQETESFYVSFLNPGISYDMKIQSFNRAGASAFSSIVSVKTTGQAPTEPPDPTEIEKEKSHEVHEDELPPTNDRLYVLLGSLFITFWIVLCISCALCYKCKQRRAEEDAKYACGDMDVDKNMQIPPDFLNGSLNIHNNGYIPTITSHLDEKETSFVERFNNNRPISPSQLNLGSTSTCDLALSSFKSSDTELKIMSKLRKETVMDVRNCNSLHRKKNQLNANLNNASSLKKLPYVSCSRDDLDDEERGSRIFPKEHYKVSRKHNRRKGEIVE